MCREESIANLKCHIMDVVHFICFHQQFAKLFKKGRGGHSWNFIKARNEAKVIIIFKKMREKSNSS
jgi:hypothetical protein